MRRIVALALIALAPVAVAGDGPDADRIAPHLQERLQLDADAATELAELIATTHADGRALREDLKAEALALKDARDAGDLKAMKRQLQAVRDVQRDLQDLEADLDGQVGRILTVEQQADFALFRLQRRMEHERRARAAQPVEVPAFDAP